MALKQAALVSRIDAISKPIIWALVSVFGRIVSTLLVSQLVEHDLWDRLLAKHYFESPYGFISSSKSEIFTLRTFLEYKRSAALVALSAIFSHSP